MKLVQALLSALILRTVCTITVFALPSPVINPRPLVIWHGMGDSYASPGIVEFIEQVKNMHPGIFVHSIYLNENDDEDRRAGWFGNVNEQVANVSVQLGRISELQHGFDAIGFSQGGQFLRAYVERYNAPPIHNLITFGSQHMGVSDLPVCKPWDLLCQLARRATRGGVYSEWTQQNIVQAQYYRDSDRLPLYLKRSHFLPDINGEVDGSVNATYAKNLASLNRLILAIFLNDTTVVPKESAWFGSYAPSEDIYQHATSAQKTIIPMRLQPIYLDDRIGLKTLDERSGIVLWTCQGEHMQLDPHCWKPLVRRWVGEGMGLPVDPSAVLRVQ